MASADDIKYQGEASAPSLSSASPVEPVAADESVQTSVKSNGAESRPRFVELLKQWPTVQFIIKRGEETYRLLKQSNRVINWGFHISEQVVNKLSKPAAHVLATLRPLVKLADSAVTEGLERLQKRLPAVKESPEKVFKELKFVLADKFEPIFHKAASVSDIGKSKIHSATKILNKIYRGLTEPVGNWMDKLEKSFDGLEGAPSKSRPEDSGALRSAGRWCFGAATTAGFFGVGAIFWVAARLPGVGKVFAEAHPAAAAPSQSTEQALPRPPAVASLGSTSQAAATATATATTTVASLGSTSEAAATTTTTTGSVGEPSVPGPSHSEQHAAGQ